ncbi:MAG: hypothetical protein EP344_19325 [Bacteroidetes bacterium]|nr:MAG: hypothetical protein EP344_19325 [Bacteroidota bacterium]
MEEPLDQLEPPQPDEDRAITGRIVFWNFGIILGYSILSWFVLGYESANFDFILIICQVVINFLLGVIAMIRGNVPWALGYLFSILLIVLTGFIVLFDKVG